MAKKIIIGVDEVGAGALAGPLLVCAIAIYGDAPKIQDVTDSKKLTPRKREDLATLIENTILCKSLAYLSPVYIDTINIRRARQDGMEIVINDVIKQLLNKCDIHNISVKIDGTNLDVINDYGLIPEYLIGGDGTEYAISCASILAKVTRDKKMLDYAIEYPQYSFDSNKGYGTKSHIHAIQKFGLSDIHRRTFCYNFIVDENQLGFWN
ncbi:MAG: ribonuclease HII [Christensenellaceae bacterium]|jgi:ribonuclease HII|nr:ribonuclease HII [Christensenellaceae bacterium]